MTLVFKVCGPGIKAGVLAVEDLSIPHLPNFPRGYHYQVHEQRHVLNLLLLMLGGAVGQAVHSTECLGLASTF